LQKNIGINLKCDTMKLCYFFSVLLFSLGCTMQNQSKTENKRMDIRSQSLDHPHQSNRKTEELFEKRNFLAWSDLVVNDLPTHTNKELFGSLFGEPDSIVVDYNHCQQIFEDEFELLYKDGFKFHLKGDSLILESAIIYDNYRIKYDGLELDNKTSLDEFLSWFDNPTEDVQLVGLDDFPFGEGLSLVQIPESEEGFDFTIHVFFKERQLFCIARLFPC